MGIVARWKANAADRAGEDVAHPVPTFLLMTLLIVAPWTMFFTGPVGPRNWLEVFPTPFVALGLLMAYWLATTVSSVTDKGNWLVGPSTWAFVVGVVELVGLFAAAYLQAAHDHSGGSHPCFAGGPIQQVDAVYVTMGLLTTAGTGALEPSSHFCRGLASVHMGVDVVVIGVGLGLLAARLIDWSQRKPLPRGPSPPLEASAPAAAGTDPPPGDGATP